MSSYRFLSWVKFFINSSYGRTPNSLILNISEKTPFLRERPLILFYRFTFTIFFHTLISRTFIFCTDLVCLYMANINSPSVCLRLCLFTCLFTSQHCFYQCAYENNYLLTNFCSLSSPLELPKQIGNKKRHYHIRDSFALALP